REKTVKSMIDPQSIKTIDLIPPVVNVVSPPSLASPSSSSTPGKLLSVYHKIIHQTLHQVQGFDSKTIESLRKHWMDELPAMYDLPSESPSYQKRMKLELASPQTPQTPRPPPPSPSPTTAVSPSAVAWQPPPIKTSKSLLASLFFGDDIVDDRTTTA